MAHAPRTTARAAAALLVLYVAGSGRAVAQSTASLDLASSRLRYSGDTASSGAFTISPTLHAVRPNASLDATAGLSQFSAGGGWSTQGQLDGAAFTPWRPVVAELAGSTGGSVHADGNRTAQSLASLRLHAVRNIAGGWVGGSLGQAWDSLGWHAVREGEGGVWLQAGDLTMTLSVAPTRIADSISYTDAQLGLRAVVDRADFVASVGTRSGDAEALGGGTQGWLNASVALWIGRNVAVTASAGRYPSDLLQGYRPATYAEIGLRLGIRDIANAARASSADRAPAPARPRPMSAIERTEEAAARAVNDVQLRPAGGGSQVITLCTPAARRVEITGDFTGWNPVALTPSRQPGCWTTTLPIANGSYEMNVRLDGGAWLVPPGLTALADEDGGTVGILVVPQR